MEKYIVINSPKMLPLLNGTNLEILVGGRL